jgi:hypothetical protein
MVAVRKHLPWENVPQNKFLRPWEREKVAAGRMRVVGKTSTIRWRKFYLAAARFGRRFQTKPILSLPETMGKKANGYCQTGPGPDWPALPELGRAQT